MYPDWYLRYEKSCAEEFGGLNNMSSRYCSSYERVVGVLEASLYDHTKINYVLWKQLSHADPRISRGQLVHVYERGWEGQEELRQVIQELILATAEPFNMDDYL